MQVRFWSVLAKRLAFVVDKLVGDTYTCVFSNRSIHDKLHLTLYVIKARE